MNALERAARNSIRTFIINAIVGCVAPRNGPWRRVLRAILGG